MFIHDKKIYEKEREERFYNFGVILRIINFLIDIFMFSVGVFMVSIMIYQREENFSEQFCDLLIQPGFTMFFSVLCFLVDLNIQCIVDRFYIIALPIGRSFQYLFVLGEWTVIIDKGFQQSVQIFMNPARIFMMCLSALYLCIAVFTTEKIITEKDDIFESRQGEIKYNNDFVVVEYSND